MIKKIILTSICTILSFGAFAEMPEPPMGMSDAEMRRGMNIMENLTDEQRSCVEAYGCQMPSHPDVDAPAVRPEQQPEMTDEQRESMECMKNAMASCGIEIPQRPERPAGEMPPPPTEPNTNEMPPAPEIIAEQVSEVL